MVVMIQHMNNFVHIHIYIHRQHHQSYFVLFSLCFYFAPRKKPKYIFVVCVSVILQTLSCRAQKRKLAEKINAGGNKPDAETLRKAVVLIDWHSLSFKVQFTSN